MTTVINLNFLNFFRLKQNNITVSNDVHTFNHDLQDRRRNYVQEEDERGLIIDVTPYRQELVVTHDKEGMTRSRLERKVHFPDHFRIEKIYNRNGKTVQCPEAKGLLVNAYV